MPYSPPDPNPSIDRYDEYRLHMEKFLSFKLVEFDISPRILFPLADSGIIRIRDLVGSSPRELLKIDKIGVSALVTIKKFMEHYKLHFGMQKGCP